jgi:WD40 repeat protein
LAYSPDGKIILTGSWDHTARLWDIATGAQLRELKGHTDGIFSVAFSPNGKTVLTGSGDRTARLWDIRTGA